MSGSDFEQDLEEALEVSRLEQASLHSPSADVKMKACSRSGGENKGERSEAKSGKARRKKRRLRNEPESIIGSGEGPSGVNVLDFMEARVTEINSMMKALRSKQGGKRVFQTLPRHMRRRAMSHNPKRLPRRLREQAAKEMEAEEGQAKKPLSRKGRRKASTMRKRFGHGKRGSGSLRLETHLWHAKRMHMVEKYNCYIADHCNDKGVRAARKSMAHGCLLSDISYYHCYEIVGKQTAIIESLKSLFHEETGLTIRAKAYLKGQREGRAVMYKAGAYPNGAIASVEFLWQAPSPIPTTTNGKSKLWIWCHPATEKQAQAELKTAVRVYNSVSSEVVTVSHRNLVRFRLIGPRSHAVLMETLKPVWNSENNFPRGVPGGRNGSWGGGYAVVPREDSDDDISTQEEEEEEEEEKGKGKGLPPAEKWWEVGDLPSQLAAHTNVLSEEYPAIKAASDPSQFGRGTVIGMCVQDPRLFTPSKQTDMVSSHYPQKFAEFLKGGVLETSDDIVPPQSFPPDLQSFLAPSLSTTITSLPLEAAFSPIWDLSVCKSVARSMFPDHTLNRKRSEKFIKSSVLSLGDSAPQIPVLLLQQTPRTSVEGPHGSLGVGWDLVLPQDWAMAFWVALVYRGARACGMKELERCDLESQVLRFPADFPDTKSGQEYMAAQRNRLEEEYLRMPPDKRLNYGSLLIPTPFHIAWDALVRRWSKWCGKDDKANLSPSSTPRGTKRDREEEDVQGMMIPPEPPFKKARLDHVSPELASMLADPTFADPTLADPTLADPGEGVSPELESSNAEEPQNLGFYVLRSKQDLNSLKKFISSVLQPGSQGGRRANCNANFSDANFKFLVQSSAIDSLLEEHASALVAVKVEIHRSGTLNKLDSLSLPSPSDLKSELAAARSARLSKLPAKRAGKELVALGEEAAVVSSEQFSGPMEVRNQRGMTLKGKQGIVVGISSISWTKMRELKRRKRGESELLVDEFRLFTVQPSRRTIGHLTSAGHRLTTSLDSGVGFVTLPGLVEAIRGCHASGLPQLLVLARGATLQYSFVKVSLL